MPEKYGYKGGEIKAKRKNMLRAKMMSSREMARMRKMMPKGHA